MLARYISGYCKLRNYQADFLANDPSGEYKEDLLDDEDNRDEEVPDDLDDIVSYIDFSQYNLPYERWRIMIGGLNGHEFERYCAYLLKVNGYTNILVTKGSGDYGVDITAVKNGIRYAIQCKNWTNTASNNVVERIHGSKDIYSCTKGIIICTGGFTNTAQKAANRLGVILIDTKSLYNMVPKQEGGSQKGKTKVRKYIFILFICLLIIACCKLYFDSDKKTENRVNSITIDSQSAKITSNNVNITEPLDQKREVMPVTEADVLEKLTKYYGYRNGGCWMKKVHENPYCFYTQQLDFVDTDAGHNAFVILRGDAQATDAFSKLKNAILNKTLYEFLIMKNTPSGTIVISKGAYSLNETPNAIRFLKMGNITYGWELVYEKRTHDTEKRSARFFLQDNERIKQVADIELAFVKESRANADEIATDDVNLLMEYSFDTSNENLSYYPIVMIVNGTINDQVINNKKYIWYFDEKRKIYQRPGDWPVH